MEMWVSTRHNSIPPMPSGPRTKRTWRQSITSIALNSGESHERAESVDGTSPVPEEPSPHDSAAGLVLECDDPSLFLGSDEGEGLTSIIPSSVNVSASLPAGLAPLPFYVLQLFLVAPSLLLGATSLQEAVSARGAGFSSIYMSILWCIAAAFLAGLSSQIWVVAARYVRKWRCAPRIRAQPAFSIDESLQHRGNHSASSRWCPRKAHWHQRGMAKTCCYYFAGYACASVCLYLLHISPRKVLSPLFHGMA